MFEDLYRDGKKIAAHADIKDEGQKIRIIKIKTKAIDKETETQNAVPGKKTVIVDTVSYEGLTPGKEYTLKGTLMDAKTGKPLKVNEKEITVEKKFKPGKTKGMVEMEFKLDSSALADNKISKDGYYKPEEIVLMPIPGSGSKEFLFCVKMYCEM